MSANMNQNRQLIAEEGDGVQNRQLIAEEGDGG